MRGRLKIYYKTAKNSLYQRLKAFFLCKKVAL